MMNFADHSVDFSFHKYQALGNDFVLLDWLQVPTSLVNTLCEALAWPSVVQHICHRHRGVGADGVLVLWQADNTIRVDIYNADGSKAKFCGNGSRCVAAHLYEQHAFPKQFTIQVGVQQVNCQVVGLQQYATWIPRGRYLESVLIKLPAGTWLGHKVDMGNPHLVIFAPTTLAWLQEHGPQLEYYFGEAASTNVEFVHAKQGGYSMLVFERGAGITQACGSGAMASAEALLHLGQVALGEAVTITMLGGEAKVTLTEQLIGLAAAAESVYTGQLDAKLYLPLLQSLNVENYLDARLV